MVIFEMKPIVFHDFSLMVLLLLVDITEERRKNDVVEAQNRKNKWPRARFIMPVLTW